MPFSLRRFLFASSAFFFTNIVAGNGNNWERDASLHPCVHAYFKVRYAKPPVGDLRFRPPEPLSTGLEKNVTISSKNTFLKRSMGAKNAAGWIPIDGVDDLKRAPLCMQTPDAWPSIPSTAAISEDCLYLDIYAPCGDATKKKPVLLWIHGGDYQWGGADDRENGAMNTASAQNVVVVVINYRLGVFGFLGSEDLRSRDTERGSTGNYGFQDQRVAMQFVQRNIETYGGDPTSVTIFGESAGAGSVSCHLSSPLSYPHYDRAIAESGAFQLWDSKPMLHAEANYKWVLHSTGCAFASDPVTCLVGIDANDLLAATQCYGPEVPYPDTLTASCFAPTVDGVELLDSPIGTLRKGGIFPGSVIFGTNADEGTLFVSANYYNVTQHRGIYSGAYLPRNVTSGGFHGWSLGTFGREFFFVILFFSIYSHCLFYQQSWLVQSSLVNISLLRMVTKERVLTVKAHCPTAHSPISTGRPKGQQEIS